MEELKNNLIKVLNNSNISLEAVLFVLRDVYHDAEAAYRQYKINQETEKVDKEEEE